MRLSLLVSPSDSLDMFCLKELQGNVEFSYYSEQLNLATVQLAEGSDAVCTFVNDFAGGATTLKATAPEVRMWWNAYMRRGDRCIRMEWRREGEEDVYIHLSLAN